MQKMVLMLLLLISISDTQAGEVAAHGMMLGFNSSTFVGDDKPQHVDRMMGLTIGGFMSYQFSPRIALQPELTFTTKGARFHSVGDAELTNIFAYLEIPVLAKYHFQTKAKLYPSIFVGPTLGFKYFALNNVGVLEDIRFTDIGLVAGTGVEFWRMMCSLRYTHGLTSFDESEFDLDVKNSTVSFILAFSFCRKVK